MLKVETNETAGCESHSINGENSTFSDDKLSLLVKAAEKLVDDEKSSGLHDAAENAESANITKLNAFVNSLKEAKNAQAFNYPLFIGKNGKPTRPFKAYPKESLSLPIGGQSTSFLDETGIIGPAMPLTVNTPSTPSTPSSCSNSPIAVIGTNNLNNFLAQNKNVLSTEQMLSLISALASNQTGQNSLTENKLLALATQIGQNDLTSLNLNDLTTADFTSLAFNPNDFCVQHRKRIQQAQERVLKKKLIADETNDESPRRRNSSGSRSKRDQVDALNGDNHVDSMQNSADSLHDEYMNYPPKKRHRIQQQEQKKANDDEPTSSNSSQCETKNETPINSPTSTTKPLESSKASVRSRQSSADEIDKDEAYRERRRKNNEAAKRSRDARRAKEDDIALRAALLERENLQLKVELAQLKQETTRLRCLLYNS